MVKAATPMKITKVAISLTPPLYNLMTEETIRAQTAILMPEKAFATAGMSIKPSIRSEERRVGKEC